MNPTTLAMLLADARLPVAGHTQSAGLEPAIAAGLGAHDVADYIALRLATVVRTEAGVAVATLHALTGAELRPGALDPVTAAWAARTPSPALRANSVSMGRALLRLACRLWPEHRVLAALPSATARPVVMGAVAHACGLDATTLASAVAYDDVQTVAAASLKLLPLDPTVATSWVLGALEDVERLAHEVAQVRSPDDIAAFTAPLIEAWAQAHAVTQRRLFSA